MIMLSLTMSFLISNTFLLLSLLLISASIIILFILVVTNGRSGCCFSPIHFYQYFGIGESKVVGFTSCQGDPDVWMTPSKNYDAMNV